MIGQAIRLFALVATILPSPVSVAQSTFTIEPNTSFKVAADPVANTAEYTVTGYRLYMNGAPQVSLATAQAVVGDVILFPFNSGLAAGTYSFTMQTLGTLNSSGAAIESMQSQAIQLEVGQAPGTPPRAPGAPFIRIIK